MVFESCCTVSCSQKQSCKQSTVTLSCSLSIQASNSINQFTSERHDDMLRHTTGLCMTCCRQAYGNVTGIGTTVRQGDGLLCSQQAVTIRVGSS